MKYPFGFEDSFGLSSFVVFFLAKLTLDDDGIKLRAEPVR